MTFLKIQLPLSLAFFSFNKRWYTNFPSIATKITESSKQCITNFGYHEQTNKKIHRSS